MVNLNTLEAEKKKAQEEKEENIVKAQIEVYEGQTYVARDAYDDAKTRRSTSRSKLPEKIPEDKAFQESLLQAQYIKASFNTPDQQEKRQQVDDFTGEINKQKTAKSNIQKLDRQMPTYLASAEQEVETTKTNIKTAKETATKTQNALIQSYSTQIKTESERRSAEMKAVHDKHQAVESPWKNGYYEKDNNSRLNSWKRATKKAYDNEIISVRMSHLKADGFSLAVDPYGASTGIGDAIERGIVGRDNVHTVRDSTLRYSLELMYAGQDISTGKIGVSEYNQRIAQAKSGQTALVEKNRLAGAQSRARAMASARSADSAKWASVASNPYTSNPNAQAPTNRSGSGTSSDPFTYNTNADNMGIPSIEVDKNKLAFYLQNYTVGNTKNNNTLENTTFSNKETNVTNQSLAQISKQRETELANMQQQQYTAELRAGNIGLADSLSNQKTTGGYTGANTVNLNAFLKERGYEPSNPDTIPNSVLTTSVKYDKARKIASEAEKLNIPMGDLRFNEPYYDGLSATSGFRYKYPEATALVQQQRKDAKQRIAQFDPRKPSIQKTEGSNALTFTDLKSPQTGTLDTQSGGTLIKKDFNPYSASNPIGLSQGYQYTVPSAKTTTFPTITGSTFEANTPTTFDTKKEAMDYSKNNQPKVFSGTDNPMWNAFNKANAVDSGEIPMPTTALGKLEYYSNVSNRPVITMGASIVNLFQPQDKQIPVREVASGKLISGTIDDVVKLDPLKGSGVKSAYGYAKADPLRTALELPAEALMWIAGGKAVQLGGQGVSAGVSASAKLGTNILASNAPNVVKIPTMAVMGAGQTVQRIGTKVSSIPNKIGSKVYDYGTIPNSNKWAKTGGVWSQQFTTPQQVVRQGIVRPYDKATMFQGSRVGFGTKANFIMTPSGRMFVRDSTVIANKAGVKPQFINRQVSMFETESVTGVITRGKMKTVEKTLPKEKSFKSDVFTPTAKTKLIPKEGYPKMDKPFPDLYDSKLTTSGKPFPDLVKVEDIPVSKIKTPNPFDRLKNSVLKDSETMPTIKKVKTAVDEVTFYSDTTGDLAKGVIRPKAELQGNNINSRAFEKPEITSTRTRLQDYKTSTSQPTIKGQLKFSDNTLQGTRIEGMVKFKGSPVRQIDTIATGVKVTGKKNLELIDTMVEKGQIEEIGKKTVMKGEDYFGGGKKFNLKQELESRYPTTFESATGKIKPKDETILYSVSKKTISVDKKAFAQTMKESNLLRELDVPPNKKPTVPEGEPIPTSSSKLNVKKFAKELPSNKSGQTLVTPTKQSSKVKSFAKEQVKLGIKKSPYSSAITGSAVITSTKSLAITSTRIDSGVRIQEKISTKTQTGLKQDQGLVQDTVVKQQMKSKSGLKSKMNIRLDTGMKLQQKQKYAVKMTIPLKTPLRSSRPKVGGFVWIPEGKAQETTLKRKRGNKAGFIGNVRLDNIMGMYKRKEITYGAKKVTKLERQDARLTSGTSNRIAQPASGLLKTKKKKKEKKTSVFGGGKDEFKGFGSKKKGKKKSSLFG